MCTASRGVRSRFRVSSPHLGHELAGDATGKGRVRPTTPRARRRCNSAQSQLRRIEGGAYPIVLAPSMVSRMMSAWPACWAVSATMCTIVRRTLRTAPSANHGAGGSGNDASRSGSSPSRLLQQPFQLNDPGLAISERLGQTSDGHLQLGHHRLKIPGRHTPSIRTHARPSADPLSEDETRTSRALSAGSPADGPQGPSIGR